MGRVALAFTLCAFAMAAAADAARAQMQPYDPFNPTLPPGAHPSLMNPNLRPPEPAPRLEGGPKPVYASPICRQPPRTRSRDLAAYCDTLRP